MTTQPLRLWFKHLQRRFSPRRVRLGSEANHALVGGDGRALACLVGRELCLFTTVDAHRIPDKERAAFVALAVKRAAPFPDPEHGLAWTGQHAAVWYWSRSRVRQRMDAGDSDARVSFSPEPLFTGAPVEDGVQLLALAHGFEGRVWKQARLVSSRWWESVPDRSQWQEFLRSAGLVPDSAESLPAVIDGSIGVRSWATSSRSRQLPRGYGLGVYLPKAALAFGLAALGVYTFQLGSLLRNHIDAWRSDRAAMNLDAPIKRVLDARQAADRHLAQIDEVLALRPSRPQLALMAEASRLLPGSNWEMRRWSQPTPDRVELSLTMPDANPEQLVTAWEASSMFDEVTTDLQPRNNLVTLRARIASLRPAAQ